MRIVRGAPLVVAALLATMPASLAAQLELGVKGGASFGNISNKGVLPGNLDSRTGFAAGVSVGLGGGLVGIGGEALYAQRGLTGDATDAKLDYLDIPVYLTVHAPTGPVAPFGYVGPQASFELKCTNLDVDCVDDRRSTTDYAAVIGAGVKLGGSRPKFTIEARYVYGLKDLKLATVTSGDSFKTRSFLILGGLVF
jgi:hypothetical protein